MLHLFFNLLHSLLHILQPSSFGLQSNLHSSQFIFEKLLFNHAGTSLRSCRALLEFGGEGFNSAASLLQCCSKEFPSAPTPIIHRQASFTCASSSPYKSQKRLLAAPTNRRRTTSLLRRERSVLKLRAKEERGIAWLSETHSCSIVDC